MKNLLLSADGDIMLYEVEEKILSDLEALIEEFYIWKKTSCFNEQLFVKFLQQKFGNEAIRFIKNLGYKIPEEFKNVKWFNF